MAERERARTGRAAGEGRSRRPRSGDIFFWLVLFGFILAILAFAFDAFTSEDFAKLFIHPFSLILALVIVVEYVWLKSTDRTRIYRMENRRLRERRRRDLQTLRRARELLDERAAVIERLPEPDPGQKRWAGRARSLSAEIESQG